MMMNYILSSIAQYENFYYYLLRSFVRLLYYDNIPYYLLASFVRSHEGNINNNAQTLVSTVQPFKF